ncbi:MAG: radical SAM protein [Candidatus Omnitrophica bacterium]|nr:radical SAM protein [Candidatus Omnitrophota bacterium]
MLKNGGDGRLVFKLDIGNICNNLCNNCYQKNSRIKGDLSLVAAKNILRKARKDRALLILSGGEPTAWPSLAPILTYARKELNFQHIQLETNARVLSYRPYLAALIRLLQDSRPQIEDRFVNLREDFSFRVKIHSHREEVHDAVSKVPGSWRQTMQGLDFLIEAGQVVTANTVILPQNYQDLPVISDDLHKRGVLAQEFSQLHGGMPGYDAKIVRYQVLQSVFTKLLAHRDKRVIFLENVPYCYLQGCEQVMADNYYASGKSRRIRYYAWPGVWRKDEYKRVQCLHRRSCRYEFVCRGVDPYYVKKFGWDCIKPAACKEECKLSADKSSQLLGEQAADAFVLFSGGVDSKCAGAIFAGNNPGKKIFLLTLDNNCLYPDSKVITRTARDVLKKYPNIFGHVFWQMPRDLARKEFIGRIAYWEKIKGFNPGCHLCVMTALCGVIGSIRKFDSKPKDLIYGFRLGSNFPRIFIHYLELFLAQYDFILHAPVLEFRDKTAVLERLDKMGLSAESNQPLCLLTDVRFSEVKGDVNNASGFDSFNDAQWERQIKTAKVSAEAFFESFSRVLLERYGVAKTREL